MEHYIDSNPGREITLNNKKYRYFGGTSYLGLQTDPDFTDLFLTNVKKFGTSYGASRNSNIRLSIYDKAEKFLVDWVGCEACATLSSGYLAGQLLADHFNTELYKTFYAPNCHSALFTSGTGRTKLKPYVTYTSLSIAVREHLALNNSIIPVVLLDSIDFSGTNYPDFDGIRSLPINEIIIVADDSHGLGVVGPKGAGVYPILSKLNPKELLVCSSLGKALGIQAGAIFGTQKRLKQLTSTNFFGGASPTAPAYLATLIDGWELWQHKRGILEKHILWFTKSVKDLSAISKIPHHPAFSYSDVNLTRFLMDNGIMVTHFPYPQDEASLTSRIVLSAAHLQDDIEYLAGLINSYFS